MSSLNFGTVFVVNQLTTRPNIMKTHVKLIIFAFVLGLIGCEKEADNTAVEDYVNLLRTNTYEAYELPAFLPSDIPALLKYRNETTVITQFPRNGISSHWTGECKLGMYVLWTIESIRAAETESKYLIGRFPSQNPILALKSSTELRFVYDENSHNEAADAYFHWWNALYIFTDKMKSDPLEDTDFRWQ
jgi:hypothetical protein